jgi:hypothetical protein
MNSSSTASLTTSSLGSMSSMGSHDGVVTPSSALSPGPGSLGPLPFRLNGGQGNMKVGGF